MSVLITGANRGIGRGLYDFYKRAGQSVLGTSRAGKAPLLHLDVTDNKSFASLSTELDGAPVELLICNAGVFLDKSQSLDTGYSPELWAETFATNVTGVFQTIQTLLPNLRAAKSAKIAIISSGMGSSSRAPGGAYIYRASKAAVLNMGRNLAQDLKPDHIALGIYHPGWVRTDMGGADADISLEQCTDGLATRFHDLSMDTSGCFKAWDGKTLSF